MSSGLVMLLFCALLVQQCAGCQATAPGVGSHRLAPCPDSPNCVSSLSSDARHGEPPLNYSGTREEARQVLLAVVNSMPRTKVVTSTEDYLHVEYRSAVFRFVDDVEFLFDDTAKVIHFRSASRVGYSDLGVNRKRIRAIKAEFSRGVRP
jgi:uncharacterized protein (DUF1499 family)